MGKLSAFIPVVADALGVPQTAVEAYVKPLRKAQMLTSGPRGTAAPDIIAMDCARIIAAVMIGSPTHAVEKINTYGSMLACLGEGHVISRQLGLNDKHTFLDMLAAIFASAAEDSLVEKITNIFVEDGEIPESRLNDDGSPIEFGHSVTVTINTSTEVAFVTLQCVGNSYHVTDFPIRYLPAYFFDEDLRKNRMEELPEIAVKSGGLFYEANIGSGVIDGVAKFLRGGDNKS